MKISLRLPVRSLMMLPSIAGSDATNGNADSTPKAKFDAHKGFAHNQGLSTASHFWPLARPIRCELCVTVELKQGVSLHRSSAKELHMKSIISIAATIAAIGMLTIGGCNKNKEEAKSAAARQ